MKNKNILIAIVSLFFFTTNSDAQESGEWTEPTVHPCYQGIKVSVVNMGHSKDPEGYRWGVRFFNDKYTLPVSFKYKLSIGEKITSKEDWQAVVNLKKEESYSDAHDKFTAWTYASSSEEWYVYIWDVCFHEMRCGGADECFAECDKTAGKENQLCGLSEEYKPTPGSNQPSLLQGTAVAPEEEPEDKGPAEKWEADDKPGELQVINKEDGLMVKLDGEKEYRFFKKIGDKTYRHEEGKDFDIIKFSTDDKFSYWHNGVLQSHYTLVKEDDGETKVRSGIWDRGGGTKAKITVTKDGLTYHNINSLDDGSPFFKRISATEYRRDDPDGIHFCTIKLKEDGKLRYLCSDKPGSYVGVGSDVLTFISADEEEKPTNEEDKYSFKGTTIWKTSSGGFVLYAIIDNFLYKTDEGGGPWWNGSNNWQLRDMKSNFPKKAPDTYEYILSKEYRESIQFIGSDKLQDDNYYKGGRKLFRTDTYPLVGKWSAESLPQAAKQNILPSDINGNWNFEPVYNALKISFTLLSQEGDKIVLTRKYLDTETFTYKKTSANTYEYKPENMAGIARLVFLSPTRICLSYVYKNYVSIGYYNKPASPPIVKVENKPVTVTENKTVSNKGGVSRKWYIGYWHLNYTADYSVDVEEIGDNLTIKFAIEPTPTGNNAIEASLSGKIITAKKSSPYTGQYKDIIGAPVWKGTYPAYEGMVPCSWIYIHDGEKEILVMLGDDGSIFKHYKTRYHQGY